MDAVVAFIANGEAITMWLRIVATVALQYVGPSARPPAASANGGQVREQGVEVGDVVDVRGRDMRHQRHPRASVTMWCLDPALRRSVGFGPVFFPRASRGPTRCPPPSSAGRAVPVGAARRGGSHASDARRRPVPTPPSVASTCCLSRIPFHAVTSATATRRAAQGTKANEVGPKVLLENLGSHQNCCSLAGSTVRILRPIPSNSR